MLCNMIIMFEYDLISYKQYILGFHNAFVTAGLIDYNIMYSVSHFHPSFISPENLLDNT